MLRILLVAVAITFSQSTWQEATAQSAQFENNTHSSLSEAQKVEKLINYIRTLEGATFIRNNSEFNTEQAAGHLASKWEKHAEKVKTAEGFIMKLASESSSGEPYNIRFADGTTSTTREVLMKALRSIDSKTP
jgi:hypothetical protein